jgi:hypothetical protein
MPEAKNHLRDLKGKEISLVDNPAIVEEFIVTKRNETVVEPVQKDAEGAPADGTPVVTAKAEGGAETGGGVPMPVHQALIDETVTAITAGLQKLVTDLSNGMDSDACRERMWAIQDLMWDLCRNAAAMNVAKSADGVAATAKTLDTIQKAREAMKVEKSADGEKPVGMKKFTKARVQKLADGLAAIHEVLSEVAPADVAKALSTDEAEAAAAETAPVEKRDPPADPAADQLRVDLQKAIDATTAANAAAAAAKADADAAKAEVAEVTKRIEALERTGVSKSAGGDAQPDPVKKNIWAGTI